MGGPGLGEDASQLFPVGNLLNCIPAQEQASQISPACLLPSPYTPLDAV